MHTLAWFAQPQLGAGSSASHLLQHEELSKLRRQAEANGGAGDTSEVLRELAAELMLVAISVFEKMPPPFRDALKRQDSANYQPEHVLVRELVLPIPASRKGFGATSRLQNACAAPSLAP